MAEHPLHCLDIRAGRDGHGRGGMPQVVRRHVRKAPVCGNDRSVGSRVAGVDPLKRGTEDPVAEVAVSQDRAVRGVEDEVVRGVAACLGFQDRCEKGRERHGPACVGLRGPEHELSTGLGHGSRHFDTPTREVDISHAQCRRLTPPQPGVGEKHDQATVRRAFLGQTAHRSAAPMRVGILSDFVS